MTNVLLRVIATMSMLAGLAVNQDFNFEFVEIRKLADFATIVMFRGRKLCFLSTLWSRLRAAGPPSIEMEQVVICGAKKCSTATKHLMEIGATLR